MHRPTEFNVVQLAMSLGMGRTTATMAVPFMWFTPESSDPMSPAIIMMVRAIQSRLSALGYMTRRDGMVDPATEHALARISGPAWRFKAWVQIFSDVLSAKKKGKPMYTNRPMGLGAIQQSDYCSTENRQGNCSPISGVCLPMNARSLGIYKELQRNLNKILKANGKSLIAVDGRIGIRETVPAYRFAAKKYSLPGGDFTRCDELAGWAEGAIVELMGISDGLPSVPDPSKSRPSVVTPSGAIKHPTGINKAGFVEMLTTPVGLALVGAGVFLFLQTRDKKKKKKAKAKAKAKIRS